MSGGFRLDALVERRREALDGRVQRHHGWLTWPGARAARRTPKASGPSFTLPGTIWLVALFVVPFFAIAAIAFGGVDPIFGSAVPRWNPLTWNFTAAHEVINEIVNGSLRGVFVRTFGYVSLALILCFVIGYPVAYYIARYAGRAKGHPAGLRRAAHLDELPHADAGVGQPAQPEGGWAASALDAVGAGSLPVGRARAAAAARGSASRSP